MTNPIIIAIILLLAFWLFQYLKNRRKSAQVLAKSVALLDESKGKAIKITDTLSGRYLGVMENRHFEILLPIFARETRDISSFYLLRDIFPQLVKEQNLPTDLVQYLNGIFGDSDEVDLIWKFETPA